MFRVEAGNQLAEKLFSKLESESVEEHQELKIYMQHLEKYGHISGAEQYRFARGDLQLVDGFLLPCGGYQLGYAVYNAKSLIEIYIFESKFEKRITQFTNSLESTWSDEFVPDFYIPQADRPDKIIRTLELVNEGFSNSFEIGVKLGHKGRNAENISRHGNYFGRAAVELKLLTSRQVKHSYSYKLTSTGYYIATCPDADIQYRLLARAMLNFYPVHAIFNEVNLGGKALTYQLIEELVDQLLSRGNHKPTTLARRARTLMRWTTWVAYIEGFPLRYRDRDEESVQLNLFSQ